MTVQQYNQAKMLNERTAITPWFRAAFASVFHPEQMKDDDAFPKYKLTMLFDRTVDIRSIKVMVFKAAREKWGSKIPDSQNYDLPANVKSPLLDGNMFPDSDGFPGTIFIRSWTKFAPQIVGPDRQPLTELDQPGFYSGCYARATVSFFAYDTSGNKGVGVYLNNLQKLADGEPFGGRRPDAADEFGAATDFDPNGSGQPFSLGGHNTQNPTGGSTSGQSSGHNYGQEPWDPNQDPGY